MRTELLGDIAEIDEKMSDLLLDPQSPAYRNLQSVRQALSGQLAAVGGSLPTVNTLSELPD